MTRVSLGIIKMLHYFCCHKARNLSVRRSTVESSHEVKLSHEDKVWLLLFFVW